MWITYANLEDIMTGIIHNSSFSTGIQSRSQYIIGKKFGNIFSPFSMAEIQEFGWNLVSTCTAKYSSESQLLILYFRPDLVTGLKAVGLLTFKEEGTVLTIMHNMSGWVYMYYGSNHSHIFS